MSRKAVIASCHPKRKHVARGMCGACYSKFRYERDMQDPNKRAIRSQKAKTWRLKNPEKFWFYDLKHKFGLNKEDYEKLCERSGGLCESCKEVSFECIDHDHSTGAVRGLLCDGCNTGIGLLREDISIMRSAIEYLESRAVGVVPNQGIIIGPEREAAEHPFHCGKPA